MWAGQDRVLDEFAVLMWDMFYLFLETALPLNGTNPGNMDRETCTWSLVRER